MKKQQRYIIEDHNERERIRYKSYLYCFYTYLIIQDIYIKPNKNNSMPNGIEAIYKILKTVFSKLYIRMVWDMENDYQNQEIPNYYKIFQCERVALKDEVEGGVYEAVMNISKIANEKLKSPFRLTSAAKFIYSSLKIENEYFIDRQLLTACTSLSNKIPVEIRKKYKDIFESDMTYLNDMSPRSNTSVVSPRYDW